MAKSKELKVTLVRSPIGFDVRQKKTLIALGLRKMNQTVTQADTPAVRGMIRKVIHLVKVEE